MTAHRMPRAGWAVVAAGVLAIGWGLWQVVVVAPSATRPVAAAAWLAGALIVHDGVIAPLAVLVGLLLVRLLSPRSRRVVAVLAFVAVSLLVLALPSLLRP